MTDADRMLKALIATPETEDRDTAALVWADALQEAGDEARAEFVRVQVELSRLPKFEDDFARCTLCDGSGGVGDYHASRRCRRCDGTGKVEFATYTRIKELLRRERDLLDRHRDEWLRVECPECGGTGDETSDGQGRCSACGGTGDATRLTEPWHPFQVERSLNGRTHRYPVTFRRGLPWRVEGAEMGELFEEFLTLTASGHQGPTWEPTPLLRAWLTHHPSIEEEVVRDREPEELQPGSGQSDWAWYDTAYGADGHSVPPVVLATMREQGGDTYLLGSRISYPTRDAAITALARAVVTVAKRHL